MDQQEPQIIDLDPESAPRTSAVIRILCGLMGLGFMLVNVVFTGEEPLQTWEWPEEDGPVQGRAGIMPNLVRGRAVDEVAPEEAELAAQEEEKRKQLDKAKKQRATTGPAGFQYQFGGKAATPSFGAPGATPGVGKK